MVNIKKLDQLYSLAEERMNSGDLKGALTVTRKMQSLGDHLFVSYKMSAMLIDIGYALEEESLLKEGVNLLEKDLDKLLSKQSLISNVFYNLANGYSGQFDLKYRKNKLAGYFKSSELNKARIYFFEAIKYHKSDNSMLLSEVWTNLGNCFNKFGRIVEAFECYDKALEYNPNHGMAMANKGVAFSYYAKLAVDHEVLFLSEAHHLISKALNLGVILESRAYFLNELQKIEKLFPDKEVKMRIDFSDVVINGNSDLEKFLIRYCLDKKLYLNICNVCQKCDASIGDTLLIKSMLVTKNPNKATYNSFLHLASYLNQMKQDYVTARFLLVLSRYKGMDLDFVDKRVKIVDTLDFNIPNVYTQLVRFAFKSFYDILDKIAIFINDYLNLGIKETKVDFRNIWFSNKKDSIFHQKIIEIENFDLNAIFDIYQELEDGRYTKLRLIRNALTHRFFSIKHFVENEDEKNMSDSAFVETTIELARLVRSTLIYLMNFVFIEEKKREKNFKGKFLTIQAQEIPDELKRF